MSIQDTTNLNLASVHEVEGVLNLPSAGMHVRPTNLLKELILIAENQIEIEIYSQSFSVNGKDGSERFISNQNKNLHFSSGFSNGEVFKVTGKMIGQNCTQETVIEVIEIIAQYLEDGVRAEYVESAIEDGKEELLSAFSLEGKYHNHLKRLLF